MKEKRPPRKTVVVDGEFKKLIKQLKDNSEIINLLIITHVDDDHIGGVIEWIKSIEFDSSMIDEVWFNSGQLINEYFNKNLENDNKQGFTLEDFDSVKTSIPDGVFFEDKIEEYGIWDRKIIKAGNMCEEFGAKFLLVPIRPRWEYIREQ